MVILGSERDSTAINPFPAILLSSAYALLAYIANIMHPDQTAPLGAVWSGFIVLATMVKVFLSAFEYMQQT